MRRAGILAGRQDHPCSQGLAAGYWVPLVAVGRDCQAALLWTSARADLPFHGSCFVLSLYHLLPTWAWPSQGCLTLVPLTRLDPGPHPQGDISARPHPCPFCSPACPRPGTVGWPCLGHPALPAPSWHLGPWCPGWPHCWPLQWTQLQQDRRHWLFPCGKLLHWHVESRAET